MTDEEIKIMIGKNIKEVLDKRGITQKEVCESTGIAESNLSKIIKGRSAVSPLSLQKIADYLKVPVQVFYDGNARNSELACKFMKDLPDDIAEAFTDSNNREYLLFGLKVKDVVKGTGVSLKDIDMAIDILQVAKKKNS